MNGVSPLILIRRREIPLLVKATSFPRARAEDQPNPAEEMKTPRNKVAAIQFAKIYPLYVKKAESKGRTQAEVDQVICWLTGYDAAGLQRQIEQESGLETFFAQAPGIHPNSALIKGVICGDRVEDIEDPFIQQVRYLDKLIDELAKGKAMEKILRK